jgi:hypothetical protein
MYRHHCSQSPMVSLAAKVSSNEGEFKWLPTKSVRTRIVPVPLPKNIAAPHARQWRRLLTSTAGADTRDVKAEHTSLADGDGRRVEPSLERTFCTEIGQKKRILGVRFNCRVDWCPILYFEQLRSISTRQRVSSRNANFVSKSRAAEAAEICDAGKEREACGGWCCALSVCEPYFASD